MRLSHLVVVAGLGLGQLLLTYVRLVSSQTNNQSLDAMVKFCLESEPDGVALIRADVNKTNSDEILILFKVDKFWALPASELIKRFDNNQPQKPSGQTKRQDWLDDPVQRPLLTERNQFKSESHWNKFLVMPQYAISFTGLESNDNFTNNVLIFKDQTMHRYKVRQMVLGINNQKSDIIVELIGVYKSNVWQGLPRLADLQHMIIPRASKILIAKHSRLGQIQLYILNSENFDSPVEQTLISRVYQPFLKNAKMRFVYELENHRSLVFLSDGDICLDEKCLPLKDLLECSGEIDSFRQSFSYWLWRDTDLTMRLIIVALSTVLVINIILGLAFIIHQTDRVSDLT